MNPTFYLFLVIGIVYYALAHQISVTQRSLSNIEDRLKALCKTEELQDSVRAITRLLSEEVRTLSGEMDSLGEGISKDIQHEIEMHELRTSD